MTAELREELSTILSVLALNALFLAVMALVLWPLGQLALAWTLVKGFAVLWLAVLASVVLLVIIQRIARVDQDTHFRTYVISNLVVSIPLIIAWSAFDALAVRGAMTGQAWWLAALLAVAGLLASYVGFAVVTAFYQGSIYRLVNLPLAAVSYLVFLAWPAAAWALMGWFLGPLGMAWP